MPGMSTFLQTKNPVVVSAFHTDILQQLLFIAIVLVVLSLAWNVLRTAQYRRSGGTTASTAAGNVVALGAEPIARRVLRIGFGLLWIGDGLLQLQSSMALGLPTSVLEPSASSSPGWVQHVVNVGVTIWTHHPVQAAASAVWIQLGIGAALLLAPRGRWSRFAGLAATGWGLVVWVFGEAFGGIFGQGSSWLFGTPGAALFYCVAGVLVALPESTWSSPRLGRRLLRATGVFFIGMAVLQAWPGRGFWQGSQGRTKAGTLTTMVRLMAQTRQPGAVSASVRAFGRIDASHGWAVNFIVVALLALIGMAFLTGRSRLVRPAVYVTAALCLADWIFVQDLGFFGGLGTDPNSMVPMFLIVVSSYLAVVSLPVSLNVSMEAAETDPVTDPLATAVQGRPWWERVAPTYLMHVLATVAAVVVVLVGVVPLASAAVNPNADPILAVAVDGTPNTVDIPAPGFHLVDQDGRPASLSGLRGRVVVLTFLDPVCTSDCPFIAQEFRDANTLLGSDSHRVVFVSVVTNEIYRSTAIIKAFDLQEGLEHMRNWLFLTGSLPALERVWDDYGIVADVAPAGAMVAHSELAYLIDPAGHTRVVLSAEPGNGAASSSSFSVYLATEIQRVIHA